MAASESSGAKISLGAELIIPVLTIAFSIYYLTTIWQLPWEATLAATSVIGALGVLMVILFVRYVRLYLSGKADMGFEVLFEPREALKDKSILLVASLAFVLLMPYLGFSLSLLLFMVGTLFAFTGREKLVPSLAVSVGMTLISYFLFIAFIEVRFPSGPLDDLLAALVFWR